MRHYYDSRVFPFLGDLLFDQLINFDWEASRKEIEEERENKKKEEKRNNNYLRVLDDNFNRDLHIYAPGFELNDGVYTYKTSVPTCVKPEDVHIDVSSGRLCFDYYSETKNGEISAATIETLPDDLDVDSMKAVFKNGTVTITAKQKELKKEEEKPEEEVEFEIEIGK